MSHVCRMGVRVVCMPINVRMCVLPAMLHDFHIHCVRSKAPWWIQCFPKLPCILAMKIARLSTTFFPFLQKKRSSIPLYLYFLHTYGNQMKCCVFTTQRNNMLAAIVLCVLAWSKVVVMPARIMCQWPLVMETISYFGAHFNLMICFAAMSLHVRKLYGTVLYHTHHNFHITDISTNYFVLNSSLIHLSSPLIVCAPPPL